MFSFLNTYLTDISENSRPPPTLGIRDACPNLDPVLLLVAHVGSFWRAQMALPWSRLTRSRPDLLDRPTRHDINPPILLIPAKLPDERARGRRTR